MNEAVEESKPWENAWEVNGISIVHLVVSESDDRVELYTDDTKSNLVGRIDYVSQEAGDEGE